MVAPDTVTAPDDLLADLEGDPTVELGPRLFGVYWSEYLPAIGKLLRRAIADANGRAVADWIKIDADIKGRVLAAVPPKPPDPEEDPANVAARDEVRSMLEELARRSTAA